jgi:hypothetical protein
MCVDIKVPSTEGNHWQCGEDVEQDNAVLGLDLSSMWEPNRFSPAITIVTSYQEAPK